MKRKVEEEEAEVNAANKLVGSKPLKMQIPWETRASPPAKPDYIFRDGLRYVRPYFFEFFAHVKGRWEGKAIVDLYAHEFRGRPYDYYVKALECGRIQVDGATVPISYALKSSQKISHFVHRHEPPVASCDITILSNEPEVLAVCKPATIPVHPCGQYRKNTVVGILEAEHNIAPLFPIHRLDRLVSGLLIFAKTATKADFFRQEIETGSVKKQYIARVVGVFPEDEVIVEANISHNPREGKSTAEEEKSKGKASCTKFKRISTNGKNSIVLCYPITGRTHQIRVHLQHVGHPIANDDLYLSEDSTAKLSYETFCNHEMGQQDLHFDVDPLCTNCPHLGPKGYDGKEEGLWLHCMKYCGTGWEYESPLPHWAELL